MIAEGLRRTLFQKQGESKQKHALMGWMEWVCVYILREPCVYGLV